MLQIKNRLNPFFGDNPANHRRRYEKKDMSSGNTLDPKILARMNKDVSYVQSQTRGARRIKIDKGHNLVVRFLPARLGPDKNWYARLAQHWLNKVPIICPKHTGDDFGGDLAVECPVCMLAEELNDDRDKDTSKFGFRVMANPQFTTYCLLWEKDGVKMPMEEVVVPYEFKLTKATWEELKGFYMGGGRKYVDSVLDYEFGNDFSVNRTQNAVRLDKLDSQPIFDRNDKNWDKHIKKIEAAMKNPKVTIPTAAQLEAFADKVQEEAIKLHRYRDDDDRPRRRSRDDDDDDRGERSRRDDAEAPRRSRSDEDDPPPRRGREEEPRDEDQAGNTSRRDREEPRSRRDDEPSGRRDDDEEPRRRAAVEEDEQPRRRAAVEEDEQPRRRSADQDEQPRSRRAPVEDDEQTPRRSAPARGEEDNIDYGPARRRTEADADSNRDPEERRPRQRDEDPEARQPRSREKDPEEGRSRRDEDPEAGSRRRDPEPDPEVNDDTPPEEDPDKVRARGKLPPTENRSKGREASAPPDRGDEEEDPLPPDDTDKVPPAEKLPPKGKAAAAEDEQAPPPVERRGNKNTADAIRSRLGKLNVRE
jgi:hypothetical protein